MGEKVFIDIDEEIIFIVEKVHSVEGERVILTVPEKAMFLGSVVSMQLLAREVLSSRKTIVLVSSDKVGKQLSQKAGLILVEKVSDITEETWKEASQLAKETEKKLDTKKKELVGERQEGGQANPKAKKEIKTEQGHLMVGNPKLVVIDGYELFAGGDIRNQEKLKAQEEVEIEKATPSKGDEEDNMEMSDGGDKPDQSEQFSSQANMGYTSSPSKRRSKLERNEHVARVKDAATAFGSKLRAGGMVHKIGIGLVALYILSFFFFRSASVTVFVESEGVAASENIRGVSTIADTDLETLSIPSTYLETNADKSSSAQSTEEIETGQQAEGEIGVFNKTAQDITLPAGTILMDKVNGLEYSSNFDVTIPGRTEDQDGITFGYEDIGVTATSHGEQYNTAGEQLAFSVSGYSEAELTGKNFKDINGGTTETAKVISQGDVDALRASLVAELESDALAKLEESAGADVEVIPDTFTYEIVNETVSPQVGERGDTFSLSLTVSGKVLSFNRADLDPLAEQILSSDNAEDLDIEEYEYESSVISVDGDSVDLQLDITGLVTPSMDEDALRKEIVGQSEGNVRGILRGKDEIADYNLEVGPFWVPGFLRRLPTDVEKIKISIRKI